MKIDLSRERFHANFPYLIIAILPIPLLYMWFMWFQATEVNIPKTLSEETVFDFGFSIAVIWVCVAIFSKSIKDYFTK